jgi:hypothetical protein
MARIQFKAFWDSAPSGHTQFPPSGFDNLPESAQRYLQHAIAPGTPLALPVRLRMHGEIKMRRWLPFRADQIIRSDRGMIWQATAQIFGMTIRGYDRLIDGEGMMRWKLRGIIPLISAQGPDITKSAAGRLKAESIWLPSVLCNSDVRWTEPEPSRLNATFAVLDDAEPIELTIDDAGRLNSFKLSRWGNPGRGPFRRVAFGGLVEAHGTFNGYTIPTQMRTGWYFGTERFGQDGAFFRVTIDDAEYQ